MVEIIKEQLQLRAYFFGTEKAFHGQQSHLLVIAHAERPFNIRQETTELVEVFSQLTWKSQLTSDLLCYSIVGQRFLQIGFIGKQSLFIIHVYEFMMIGFGISFYRVNSVNEMIDVLKTAVHSESTSWSVSVGGVSSQKDIIPIHLLSHSALQFPSTNVLYPHLIFYFIEILLFNGSLNELQRRIYSEQIDKGLIVRYLKYKLSLFKTVIDQHAGNVAIIYKVKHGLYFKLLQQAAQLLRVEIDIDEFIKLLRLMQLDIYLGSEVTIEAITQNNILGLAQSLVILISYQIALIILLDAHYFIIEQNTTLLFQIIVEQLQQLALRDMVRVIVEQLKACLQLLLNRRSEVVGLAQLDPTYLLTIPIVLEIVEILLILVHLPLQRVYLLEYLFGAGGEPVCAGMRSECFMFFEAEELDVELGEQVATQQSYGAATDQSCSGFTHSRIQCLPKVNYFTMPYYNLSYFQYPINRKPSLKRPNQKHKILLPQCQDTYDFLCNEGDFVMAQ